MDAQEARDHIEMVDRILATAEQRPLRPWPALLIVFGLGAGLVDAGQQVAVQSHSYTMIYAGSVLLLAGFVTIAVMMALQQRRGCVPSALEAAKGRTIGAVWLCIIIASFAQPHVLSGWSAAAIWTIGAAIQMAIFAASRDRIAGASAIVLLASLIGANFAPAVTGFVLAAGFLVGYFIPGCLYIADRASEE